MSQATHVDPAWAGKLADAVREHEAPGAAWPPPAPRGWEHLPVSLVDTVFSLQARYSRDGEVFAPVQRYAEWMACQLGVCHVALLAGIRDEPPEHVHGVSEMVEHLRPLPTAARVEVFGSNRPAYTSMDAPRRADTVVMAADALAELGVETRHDFERHYSDPDRRQALHSAWRAIPGFGKRSWEYIAMLCGLPGVKADVHVTRFVARAVGAHGIAPDQARDVVFAATDELRRREPSRAWTPGGVEHLLWRVESGRSPLEGTVPHEA